MTEFLNVQRCGDAGGKTKAGTPCRSPLGLGVTGLCMSHDPERQAEAREVRAAGGRGAGAAKRRKKAADPAGVPPAPRTLDDAAAIASWITRAVLVGEIDVRVAEAATKAVRQFQLTEEKRTMEKQIKALRAELAAARGKTKP